jgi:hypothetical protein
MLLFSAFARCLENALSMYLRKSKNKEKKKKLQCEIEFCALSHFYVTSGNFWHERVLGVLLKLGCWIVRYLDSST